MKVGYFALLAIPFAAIAANCASNATMAQNDAGIDGGAEHPMSIASSAQRSGDPAKGYDALVNEGYVGCGMPWTAWSKVIGAAPESQRLSGRRGHSEQLAYNVTAFKTPSGVEVVSPNCLSCHAAMLQDKLVVGLGNSSQDYTSDPAANASLAMFFLTDQVEKDELNKFVSRLQAVAPYTKTETIGVNPADNVAAVLFAHRDRKTFAWSDTPLLALPPKVVVPVDVPPWWRMSKKNAMFYTAAGRGDHARIMTAASTLCVDSVEIAKSIDAYFGDVRAYVASIKPPKYPFAVDETLAAKGQRVFGNQCSRCHGTYGEAAFYPNLLLPLADVGTDPALASGAAQFAGEYVTWFNESFFGETSNLKSETGYYAPPLDGIWATAPFLHNGSVPSIAALLESKTRPTYWTRSFDSNDYNPSILGWNFTALESGQDAEQDPAKRIRIYDTTKLGYAATGHTFGDALSAEERSAVIEYLKTL